MLYKYAVVALCAATVSAVPALEFAGTDFYNPNTGEKFQIVGMAYQPGGSAGFKAGSDPLSDKDKCTRDAALMQVMGINTIRSYNLNPELNHDACASIFNAAGIYMIIDVNAPGDANSLSTYNPWESYYSKYSQRTFAILEAFSNYPNTLAFFSGNEVMQKEKDGSEVPPYLRAVTRDLKQYQKNNIKRRIPIGYSAADVRDILADSFAYLQCHEKDDEDDMSKVDIFALNSYSWCGPKATYHSSTYDALTAQFKDSSVPVFLSEYGCNEDPPRLWKETHSIYGSDMAPTFSGAVAYEWTEEDNKFGFAKVDGDELQLLGDFNRLKDQLATFDWKKVQSVKADKKEVKAPTCGSDLIKLKEFDKNFTLPVPPPSDKKLNVPSTADMIKKGISPKPSGKIIKLSSKDYQVKLTVKDEQGNVIKDLKVTPLGDDEFNWSGKNKAETGKTTDGSPGGDNGNSTSGDSSDDSENAGVSFRPALFAAALPALALLFL